MDSFIQDLIAGNQDAYKKLIELYSDRVFNIILTLARNQEDAEDLTQEVFIEVFNSISKFRDESSLFTWIYRIAVNKALESLRRKKRKKRFAFVVSIFSKEDEELEIKDFEHPGVIIEKKEKAAVFFKALDKLPENQKIAYTLHKIEDLSYQEICKVMGISLPSVESLIHRAKQNLKKTLNSYYYDEK